MAKGTAKNKATFVMDMDATSTHDTLKQVKEDIKSTKKELQELDELMRKSAIAQDGQYAILDDRRQQKQAQLETLQQMRKSMEQSNKDFESVLSRFNSGSSGTIKQMREDLRALQGQFKQINPATQSKELKAYSDLMGQLNFKVREQEKALKAVIMPEKELQSIIANIKTAPIDKLKLAQEELTRQVNSTTRGTLEWVKANDNLKKVKTQIEEVSKATGQVHDKWDKAISRLKTYVGVYLGFNKVMDMMRNFATGALGLSDSIADVQKVTKMAAGEVDNLSKAIDRIDSRSSQEQLHKLAYQAGLLGLSSTKDILGFVKAADQMNWALKELGEDGAVQLMKVAKLTGEIDKFNSVEIALSKVGSAINEITANSAANAKDVTEIVSRLGQVGSTAGYTSDQMVALASTMNALGVKSEMGATAMQRVMVALQTNTSGIAEQLNITSDEIKNAGSSMDQLMFVLTKMKEMMKAGNGAPMEILESMFKDFGSEGVRLKSVLTAVVDNVGMLNEHLAISSAAFDDATSMLNEYEIKNETAAALVDRMGNAIRENFINSGLSRWLQTILKNLVDIFEHTSRHIGVVYALRAAMLNVAAIGVVKGYNSLKYAVIAVVDAFKNWRTKIAENYNALLQEAIAKKANTVATQENTNAKKEADLETQKTTKSTEANTAATTTNTVAVGGLQKAWIGLKAAFASNPFGLILTAITTLGPLIWGLISSFGKLKGEIEGTSDAIKEANKEIWDEERRLTQLYKKLEDVKRSTGNVNEKNKERVQIIHLINARYGKYLSNQLSETANNVQIAKSLAEVNRQMRINATLKLKQQLDDKINSQLADSQGKAYEGMYKSMNKLFNSWGGDFKKGQNESSVSAKILSYIEEQAKTGKANTVMVENKIRSILQENIEGGGKLGKGLVASKIQIRDLARDYANLARAIKVSEEQTKFANQVVEARANAYGATMQQIIDAENKVTIATEGTTAAIREQQDTLKNFNVEQSMDVNALVGWQKKLNKLANMGKGNAERARLYKMYFGDDEPADSAKRISEYADKINQQLAYLGYNDTGSFRHSSGSGRGRRSNTNTIQKDIKKEVDAALDALRGYYEEQRRMEDENRIAGRITDQELKERLERLNEFYKIDLNELYQKLLGNQSNFEQSIYGNWFSDKDLTKLQKLVKQFGSTMEDGMAANAATAAKDAREIVIKHMAAFDKVLMQYDYTGQVDRQYQQQLEQLNLFWDQYKERNSQGILKSAEQQMKLFTDLSKEVVGLDAAGLKALMAKRSEFALWTQGKTDKDYEALLITLLDYHDATIEAEKKYQQRMHKIVEQEWKDRAKTQDELLAEHARTEAYFQQLQQRGLVREREVNIISILYVRQQIEYQKQLIAALKRRGADTQKEEEALTALYKREYDKQNEIREGVIKRTNEYAEALKNMTSAMAEAAIGDSNLTKLAEIEAKRKLGIAIDETKSEYLIYNRNGKAITQMMSEEERLRWEIQNNARNAQLDALTEWLKDLGQKFSDDITNAMSSRAATKEAQRMAENELATEQDKTRKILELESNLTSDISTQHNVRLLAAQATADAEVDIARRKKEQIDAINSGNAPATKIGTGGAGVKPGGATSGSTMMDGVGTVLNNEGGGYYDNLTEGVYNLVSGFGDLSNTMYEAFGLEEWAKKATENMDNMTQSFKAAKADMVNTEIMTDKKMQSSQNSMAAAMISAMNMYAIAYQAATNDSLSATQRAGIATLQAVGQVIMSLLGTVMSQLIAETAANSSLAISRAFAKMPLPAAIAAIAGITATIGAAMGIAVSKITKSKKEVAQLTGASDGGKKVAAGMLTYAEGNYPVLGSDGEVYDAKRVDKWQTKIYRSPHYGILGEKGPELIVDGVTTNKMMTQRPDLYNEILALAHGMTMQHARTYADGNYPAVPATPLPDYTAMQQQRDDALNAQLQANTEVMAMLAAQLQQGITIAPLGKSGAVNRLASAQKWMERHGM